MEQVKYPPYPGKQEDFRELTQTIAASWAAHPEITLQWTTAGEFSTKANLFKDAVNNRIGTGSARPAETTTLHFLDNQIEDHTPDLKGYIIGKVGLNNAPGTYPQFGMVHRNNHWKFPEDHSERKLAINM